MPLLFKHGQNNYTDQIYLRRILNQYLIDGYVCNETNCIELDCYCSIYDKKSWKYKVPCHIWKRTKLNKLIKGDK